MTFFDPAGVGRMGIDAAAEVVERLLEFGRTGFLRTGPAPAEERPTEDPDQQLRRLRADADRIIDLSAEITRILVDTAIGMAEDRTAAAEPDLLVLGPVAPGETASGTAWLHLLDGPPSGEAQFHSTALTHHTSASIPAADVSFAPSSFDTAAVRSSIPVTVTVVVPATAAPGSYHGHALATGLPEVVLPVRVDVR